VTPTTPTPTDELDVLYEGLPQTATADFHHDGFIHLTWVLSSETIAHYEPTITSEVIRLNTQQLPLEQRDTYGNAFLQVSNLWRENEKVRRLVFSRQGAVPRRVMTVIYMDADMRVAEPANPHQVRDRAWMPDVDVGQVADTPLNPVLFDGRAI